MIVYSLVVHFILLHFSQTSSEDEELLYILAVPLSEASPSRLYSIDQGQVQQMPLKTFESQDVDKSWIKCRLQATVPISFDVALMKGMRRLVDYHPTCIVIFFVIDIL